MSEKEIIQSTKKKTRRRKWENKYEVNGEEFAVREEIERKQKQMAYKM